VIRSVQADLQISKCSAYWFVRHTDRQLLTSYTINSAGWAKIQKNDIANGAFKWGEWWEIYAWCQQVPRMRPQSAYSILRDLHLLRQDQNKIASPSRESRARPRLQHDNTALTGSVFVPVLRLWHLWDRELGVVAECSEEVGSGKRRRLHHIERRKTTQSPTSLRRCPASKTTSHALQCNEFTTSVTRTENKGK